MICFRSLRFRKKIYTIPPGREDKIITIEDITPRARHEAGGIWMEWMEPNRLTKEVSRNPMPFTLIGIIEIRVITGTKIRKYDTGISSRRPNAIIHVTEMTSNWLRKDIKSDPISTA